MTDKPIKKYVVYSHSLDESLIYIGCGNPQRPFNRINRTELWKSVVGNKQLSIKILGEFFCKKEALAEEISLINRHQPQCNQLGVTANNPPTEYERIAVEIEFSQKIALINYAAKRGQSVSYVVRKLLEKLLKAEK